MGVFPLLGGLALFVYSMNGMSEGLRKAAGEKLKTVLGVITRNAWSGVLAGALVTAVLQSSSAAICMAVGFVSAGLIGLPQAIAIIFGANIGTTVTAQILAFPIGTYAWGLVFAGFVLLFFGEGERLRNVGQTVFSFGLLFVGIETMGNVMRPLASSRVFTKLLGQVADLPVLGVLVGAGMTLVVQSSSATIAVLQNFAATPVAGGTASVVGLAGAVPVLLGDNIGTTVTSLLASAGQTADARRAALAHSIFNITGAAVCLLFLGPFTELVRLVSPSGPEVEILSRQIANAHTLFNIINTLLWLPLVHVMEKAVIFLIPDASCLSQDRQENENPVNRIQWGFAAIEKEKCKEDVS